MEDRIFESYPFGIIRLSLDNRILRQNHQVDQFFKHLSTEEQSTLVHQLQIGRPSLWTCPDGNTLYLQYFEVEASQCSLILMGTHPDFTNQLPDIFEQNIENFTADPHEVIDKVAALVQDAVTFERFDLLRVDPKLRNYHFEYSIGINIEGTIHTAYSEIKNSGLNWIFTNEVPHLIYDLGKINTGFLEDPLLYQTGFRSVLRVPIVYEQGVVGAILLASIDTDRFELEDAFLINQLARLVAQDYYNSGHELDYEYQKVTATAFIQAVSTMINETNVKDFLSEFCEKVRSISGLEHVCLFLLDSKKKQRLSLAEAGRESFDSSGWYPIWDTGMVEMFRSQSIVSFNLKNPHYSDLDHLLGKGFTSAIYTPIFSKGQIIGMFGAVSSDETALSSSTASLFKFFSEQLGLIIRKIPYKQALNAPHQRKTCQTVLHGFQNIIGTSPVIQDTIRRAALAAQYDFPILITGETGTGKELFAKAIHQTSQVADGPFIVVNSAAIPENLLESELFGYQEGAFTGGLKGGKRGKVFLADGGTLFLDEIGELSPELQAKLLRVIQEQEVEPLGSINPIPVHVRFISATHRDLDQMVQEGTFREDLLYRLNAIEIQLPPLRKRGHDIIELAEHMLKQLSQSHGTHPKTFSPFARDLLLQYSWPGNVRQLQNIVNRLFVFVESATIQPQDLPPDFRSAPESSAETERDRMERLLTEFEGNKTALAHYLGITRTGLWKKLKRLELQ